MMLVRPQTEPSASRSSVELVLRHPEDARHLSDQELGWLSLALRGDPRGSLDGLLEDIELEEAQLWSVKDDHGETLMLIVTRILTYELCDTFEIQLAGGTRLRDCLQVVPDLERHARNLDCKLIELRGRPGWQRLMRGYRMRGVALEKEL
jgi:hypothetical protein